MFQFQFLNSKICSSYYNHINNLNFYNYSFDALIYHYFSLTEKVK